MRFPASYLDFLFHFHGDRDYFECHEVLEEYWKANGMKRNSIWVGLIQVAVAFYHYRRGNLKGALKMVDKALIQLSYNQEEVYSLGIEASILIEDLRLIRSMIQAGEPYKLYYFPIHSSTLLALCKTRCEEQGFSWEAASNYAPSEIIHKHQLRDRTDVVAERQRALAGKELERQLLLIS